MVLRSVILLLLLNSAGILFSQTAGKYRVVFTDKNNSPYAITNPGAFLSQRAIDRRTQHGVAVTLEDIPVNQSYLDSLSAKGATVINTSRWFNSAVVLAPTSASMSGIVALPFVDTLIYLAPVVKGKMKHADKFREESEHVPLSLVKSSEMIREGNSEKLKNTVNTSVIDYGMAYNQISMLQGDVLHTMGYTGSSKIIAVLDAGFLNADWLPVFDSARSDGRILGTRDFVEPGNNVYNAHSHGTNVLSTMAANIPAQMVGTAPHASYWLLRSEDANSEYLVEEDNWVAAAEFADSAGADVINSSLSYTEFWDSSMDHTYEDMDGSSTFVTRGADKAASKGMVVIISAGNYGGSSWNYIGAPADADSGLAIGAVDAFGTIASFSSLGPSYDGRVKPDVVAQGLGTTIADTWGTIVSGNGTSFSGPVIAGMVACLWDANPSMTNMQLLDAVKHSSSQYLSPDSIYGYGIPNFATANILLRGINLPDFDKDQQIKAFPNPFRDYIDIVFNSSDTHDVSLTLADISGKIVSSMELPRRNFGFNQIVMDGLGHLSNGVYILRMVSADRAVSLKMIKKD